MSCHKKNYICIVYILVMNYIGEHLIVGILGNFFISSSIILLLLSLFFYLYKNGILKKIARICFVLHFVTLTSSAFLLFYIILNHYFEFKYVWQYSSLTLPLRYIISCFWAGQEGSFLLWSFWQALLGLILLKTSKEHEKYVFPTIILAQIFLLSMVAGWNFFGIQIGSSPFLLLRQTVSDIKGTIFAQPNYIELLGDGNGLNPLLENFWMMSHPPVLFLGYAATIIPYAYAISFMLKGDKIFPNNACKWVVFSLIALGTGLILGGRWAYESLTFGGFWAWDPVENASLVPFLVLLAGQHLILASKTDNAISRYSAIVIIVAFVMVIYSSFLTRSGVLGSSSVHAFSNNGTSPLLLIFLFTFILVPIVVSVLKKNIIHDQIEKNIINWNDTNFWLLIFVFAILLSAFQIILTTSLPLLGRILGVNFAPPQNNASFYAFWQIPFAIIFCISLIFYNFKKKLSSKIPKFKLLSFACLFLSLFITYYLSVSCKIVDWQSILLLFFSILLAFSVFFVFSINSIASNITHLGVSLFFTGIILAFNNPQNLNFYGSHKDSENISISSNNITLLKDSIVRTDRFYLKYSKNEKINNETFYNVEFYDLSLKKLFVVKPSVNINNNFGFVYNPSVKHLLSKDILTHLVNVENVGDFKSIKQSEIKLNDTLVVGDLSLIFNKLKVKQPESDTNLNNVQINADFIVKNKMLTSDSAKISYIVKDGYYRTSYDLFLNDEYKLEFKNISDKSNTIIIELFKQTKDVIVIKSTVFNLISILWTGVILILFGFLLVLIKKRV